MKELKITDVRVNPKDAAFLIDDEKTAILYDKSKEEAVRKYILLMRLS